MPENTIYNPFPGDSYDTPDNTKTSLWEYLCFKTRLSFYIRNFYVFYKSGRAGKAGKLTADLQVRNAMENIRITESCGGKIHLHGLDNLHKFPEAAVIISNHQSLLETALFHAFLRPHRDFCFVVKKELYNIPAFGDILRTLDCIAVGRSNPRDDFRAVIEEGTERLHRGKTVIVFPQSTRSVVFDRKHFNTIGVKLARAANAPIIPCALRTDFLANGKWIKDLGPIVRKNPIWFEFGEPIMKIEGNGKAEHEQIADFIASHVIERGGKAV